MRPGVGIARWWPAIGAFVGVLAILLLVAMVTARLLVLQVPVTAAPAVDFEFGPLEPGSVTSQGLGDLGESVSGIALPVVAYGGRAGRGYCFGFGRATGRWSKKKFCCWRGCERQARSVGWTQVTRQGCPEQRCD